MLNIKAIISALLAIILSVLVICSCWFLLNMKHARELQAQGFFMNKYQPKNKNSINFLKRSISMNDWDFRSKWYLAQIYFSHNMLDDAAILLQDILRDLDLSEIRMLLYNTYAKMQDYDSMASQSLEIYKRYGFSGDSYKKLSRGLNNLIEYRIMSIASRSRPSELEKFINSIFSTPYKNLPYEHFRGIKHAIDMDCPKAAEYFIKYNRMYINKQILALYACCLEKEGYKQGAHNLIEAERQNVKTNPVSRFMVDFYENCRK